MADITTDQLTLLREAHYEGAAYLIAGPQSIVFAARVNGAPNAASSDYDQLTFDTVTTGAYTDLIVDMDVRISHTNDVRKAFFYGRVRKTPTSTILYINETSAGILDNDYIFAVDNYPMVMRQRYRTFVDRDVPYTPPPPIESNVDSAYVALTRAATAAFTLSSIGQAIAKDATITDVLWSIPDATYTTGSAADAEIEIEVDTPYNRWAHLTLTDSNGTTNTLHFTITAGDPNTAPFFRLCHDPAPVSSDWNNGFTSSATYWSGVSDLLNRTRITLVSEETFDGDSLGLPSSVQFVGYLSNTTSSTAGDEVHGQRKDVEIQFAGLIQLAGKRRFNQIAIRNAASPTAWDYINVATTARNIVHELAEHSMFLRLCSLDLSGIGIETYRTGNANVEDTSVTDAARKAVKEIGGYLIQSAAGRVTLVRDPRVADDTYRASLPNKTPEPINLGDVYSYKLGVTDDDTVGWMDVGCLVVSPTTGRSTFITANAPASGPGDGQEDAVEPSQLLASTDDLNAALTEAKQRTGDLYQLANPHRTLEVNFGSGWGGVVRATPGEYYQFEVDADDDTRGDGISPDTDWLCLSVNTTINRTGTQDTIGQFVEVTQGGDALINASISPSVIDTPVRVSPVISAYPSQPMAASINYDSPDPTRRNVHDPFSGMQTLPLPTEEAAQAAQNQAGVGESKAYTNFRYDTNIAMGFTTVLGADYLLTVEGSATKSMGTFSLLTVAAPWDVELLAYEGRDGPDYVYRVGVVWTGFQYSFLAGATEAFYLTGYQALTGTVDSYQGAWGNVSNPPNNVSTTFLALYANVTGLGTTARVKVAPVTPTPSAVHMDPFYTWEVDDDGKPFNVALNAVGLRLDNAAVAVVPPFSENHIYKDIPFTGTGNPINFKYFDTDYTDNQSAPMYLTAEGPGAGS